MTTNELTDNKSQQDSQMAEEPSGSELKPDSAEQNDDRTSITDQSTDESKKSNGEHITPESDLSQPDRRIWVITTAALPWRTGTAVNPLMRALYLTRGRPKYHVTLMIPWLSCVETRKKLYGDEFSFAERGKDEQEEWIRMFCRDRANCQEEEKNLRILFWDGVYRDVLGSIFPAVDICSLIPKKEADVAILEEPEHLNWFRLPSSDADEEEKLGWQYKFKHVVGVLHTNYAAYAKQFGMGTQVLTAPALNGLSSWVVRAYCHKIIRLSAILPSLDTAKEVTSNVHGVRSEFLDPPNASKENSSSDETHARVYFVGKLLWAKGFDQLLELQELFRDKTGEYFPMDVYGNGENAEAIKRAFFGRQQTSNISDSSEKADSASSSNIDSSQKLDVEVQNEVQNVTEGIETLLTEDMQVDLQKSTSSSSLPIDVSAMIDCGSFYDSTARETKFNDPTKLNSKPAPLDILSDLSGKTLNTGVETAEAALKLIESVVENFFIRTDKLFSHKQKDRGVESDGDEKPDSDHKHNLRKFHRPHNPLGLVPSKARFKWRRTPIPAKFHGAQDHIIVREFSDQTIFLNMSISEVLCTTSAEALAMGKFVILPKHASNEFFFQFPNCLSYTSLEEAADMLKHALENKPKPLTEEYMHMLSWDGAIERLYDASAITIEEAFERKNKKVLESDTRAARFHVESCRKSRFVRDLFDTGAKGAHGIARKLSPKNSI